MPICGDDDKLKGMLTDRDIVVKVLAEGRDPNTCTARDLEQGKIFYVDADAPIDDVIHTMAEHKVRRVPVIEDHRLVGIIAQADIARAEPDRMVGELVGAISQ
jgi:CBS domain-containing protein